VERPIVECDASVVRARIARCWLSRSRNDPPRQSLGEITLRPHQRSAVERLTRAISDFGGALLCDEVGLGKTYVALAVAKQYGGATVVGPAVLRSMWGVAAARAAVPVSFLSFESLSRGRTAKSVRQFLIVDEAHHARNPETRRYAALRTIARNTPVLLLSATPIHNQRADLTALLALFLGSRAGLLDASEISRCVVRRTVDVVGSAGVFPKVIGTVWLEAHANDGISQSLLALPPPLPLREAGEAQTLVVRSLLRQWASSDDALVAALKRRIRRGAALASALEGGTYPSAIELESWVRGDDEVQLGFAALLAPPITGSLDLLAAVQNHAAALRRVLLEITVPSRRTRITADALRSVRAAHPTERIVAFSQYADTILGLYREMRADPRICALTGRGASIASGRITRENALRLFAPRASGVRDAKAIERIDLLLTTDLLSEGVNLQDASVVVHLDMPWTPARIEQRTGRVARMGSLHDRVSCYAFAPPAAAETVLGLAATITRKEIVVARVASVPEAAEAIRAELMLWQSNVVSRDDSGEDVVIAAAVAAEVDGFVALNMSTHGFELIGSDCDRLSSDPLRVIELLRHARGESIGLPLDRARSALRQIEDRLQRCRALAPADAVLGTKVRRGALRRLAAVEAASVGHRRLTRLPAIERARETLAGPMDAAAEDTLDNLLQRGMSDDLWIDAVATLSHRTTQRAVIPDAPNGPVALLLLVRERQPRCNAI
jgi:hypothetical protein